MHFHERASERVQCKAAVHRSETRSLSLTLSHAHDTTTMKFWTHSLYLFTLAARLCADFGVCREIRSVGKGEEGGMQLHIAQTDIVSWRLLFDYYVLLMRYMPLQTRYYLCYYVLFNGLVMNV
jgi:hypothetical protein